MKILDKYIIKKVLSTFFFVMMILVAIIVVIDVTEKVDKFNDHHLEMPAILGYYMDFVPWISGLLTPIICFIAIVYVTSRLAAHTEILAMLSSGMSFLRLLVPYFIASFIIASLSFFFNGWVIPHSNRERLAFEAQYFQNKFYFESRNVHMQTAPNVFLYMQTYNNQSNIGYAFSLEKFQDNRLIEKLTAENIQWDSIKHKWTLHYWKRKKVDAIFEVNSKGDSLKPTTASLEIKTGDDLKVSNQQSPELNAKPNQDFRTRPLQSFQNKFAEQGDVLDTTLIITPKDFESNAHKYDGMTIPELGQQIAQLRFRGTTGV